MSLSGIKIVLALVVGCSMFGCSNIGTSPAGGSAEEIKAAFDKMPLEDQVKLTKESSMPADKKNERIAELYKKAGKTPPDEKGGSTGAPSGPPPGVGTPSQGGR